MALLWAERETWKTMSPSDNFRADVGTVKQAEKHKTAKKSLFTDCTVPADPFPDISGLSRIALSPQTDFQIPGNPDSIL
jgi:hypothetical protein